MGALGAGAPMQSNTPKARRWSSLLAMIPQRGTLGGALPPPWNYNPPRGSPCKATLRMDSVEGVCGAWGQGPPSPTNPWPHRGSGGGSAPPPLRCFAERVRWPEGAGLGVVALHGCGAPAPKGPKGRLGSPSGGSSPYRALHGNATPHSEQPQEPPARGCIACNAQARRGWATSR